MSSNVSRFFKGVVICRRIKLSLMVETVEPLSKSFEISFPLIKIGFSVGVPKIPAGVLTLLLLGTYCLAIPMDVLLHRLLQVKILLTVVKSHITVCLPVSRLSTSPALKIISVVPL